MGNLLFALMENTVDAQTKSSILARDSQSLVRLLSDSGKGRVVCVLQERSTYSGFAQKLAQALAANARVVWIETERVHAGSWERITEGVRGIIAERSIRQASLVSLGAAGTLLQHLCLTEPRLVRTAVFVDAATRAHPSRGSRVVDWLEEHLPLGLPLRQRQEGFDGKPFLQRIRCPSLVVTSRLADEYLLGQAQSMVSHLPTAWRLALEAGREENQLMQAVLDFYDIPARCPQKNLRSEGTGELVVDKN